MGGIRGYPNLEASRRPVAANLDEAAVAAPFDAAVAVAVAVAEVAAVGVLVVEGGEEPHHLEPAADLDRTPRRAVEA